MSKKVILSYGAVLSLTSIHSPIFWIYIQAITGTMFEPSKTSNSRLVTFLCTSWLFSPFAFSFVRNHCMVQDPPLFFKATMSDLDVTIMVPHWDLVGILTCSFLVTRGRTCLHHVSFLTRSYFSSVSSSRHYRMWLLLLFLWSENYKSEEKITLSAIL